MGSHQDMHMRGNHAKRQNTGPFLRTNRPENPIEKNRKVPGYGWASLSSGPHDVVVQLVEHLRNLARIPDCTITKKTHQTPKK
jgi:hypothetical protein